MTKFAIKSRVAAAKQLDKVADKKKLPFTISQPIGPIANSRGPDLTRSHTFVIVEGIKDCGPKVDATTPAVTEVLKFRKRLSVGIRGTLSSTQLVTSDKSKKQSSRKMSFSSLLPRPRFHSSASTTLLPLSNENPQDKATAVAPESSAEDGKPKNQPQSRIPKSQTMNALCEIKNSASTHVLRSVQSSDSTDSAASNDSKSQYSLATASSTTLTSPTQTEKDLSPSSASSFNLLDQPSPRKPHFTDVTEPQPSAYWCGRFVSLLDRACTEKLAYGGDWKHNTERRSSIRDDKNYERGLKRLPPLDEEETEESRCLRLLSHLESCCVTVEARHSFYRWQHAYARQQKLPRLLPGAAAAASSGDRPKDRGLVGRFSRSNKTRKVDRRSRDFLDDMYYGNTSNAFGLTNLYGVDSRYLSFR